MQPAIQRSTSLTLKEPQPQPKVIAEEKITPGTALVLNTLVILLMRNAMYNSVSRTKNALPSKLTREEIAIGSDMIHLVHYQVANGMLEVTKPLAL